MFSWMARSDLCRGSSWPVQDHHGRRWYTARAMAMAGAGRRRGRGRIRPRASRRPGRRSTKLSALATRAAQSTWSMSGSVSPRAMFSAMVPSKRWLVCSTKPIWRGDRGSSACAGRRSRSGWCRRSAPEAGQAPRERRPAGAAAADDGHQLARGHVERDVPPGSRALHAAVAEGDGVQGHAPSRPRTGSSREWSWPCSGLVLQDVVEAVDEDRAELVVVPEAEDRGDGPAGRPPAR